MARAKVVHSKDGCMIIFKGNKAKPEPSTGVIKFPGGHVEVSRTSDGKYWAHINVDVPANIVNSRIDYCHKGYNKAIEDGEQFIPKVPYDGFINHIAVEIDGPYVSSETL